VLFKVLKDTLHVYTWLQGASGLGVLLKDTSTRARIEPPTLWLEDGPANFWPTVAPNIIIITPRLKEISVYQILKS